MRTFTEMHQKVGEALALVLTEKPVPQGIVFWQAAQLDGLTKGQISDHYSDARMYLASTGRYIVPDSKGIAMASTPEAAETMLQQQYACMNGNRKKYNELAAYMGAEGVRGLTVLLFEKEPLLLTSGE